MKHASSYWWLHVFNVSVFAWLNLEETCNVSVLSAHTYINYMIICVFTHTQTHTCTHRHLDIHLNLSLKWSIRPFTNPPIHCVAFPGKVIVTSFARLSTHWTVWSDGWLVPLSFLHEAVIVSSSGGSFRRPVPIPQRQNRYHPTVSHSNGDWYGLTNKLKHRTRAHTCKSHWTATGTGDTRIMEVQHEHIWCKQSRTVVQTERCPHQLTSTSSQQANQPSSHLYCCSYVNYYWWTIEEWLLIILYHYLIDQYW